MILAAIKREQLSAALNIARSHSVVVFATLDGRALGKVRDVRNKEGKEIQIYFYEPG